MNILQVCTIALIGIVLSAVLKETKTEYNLYVIIVIFIIIFFASLTLIGSIRDKLASLSNLVGENGSYYAMLFKMMGITYVCEFSAALCKDAGYQGIALQVEMFGKISIIISGFPILLQLIETIQNFAL